MSAGTVLHTRYSVDSARQWFGIGPLGWARATGTLAANLETRLGQEAGGPVAQLLTYPTDGGDGTDDDPLASLKKDIASAKGRALLVETTSAGLGEGRQAVPRQDWQPARLGAKPPDALGSLRGDVSAAVLSACGVPVSLVTDADGTSQRESWRRFAMGSVAPLLAIVGEEIERKLDVRVSFDLSSLWAHDLAGRASSFAKLVQSGMALDKAAALSGLLAAD